MTIPAELTTLILCGGSGTRLRSVIGPTPKVLAPVAGCPFVDHLLRSLYETGLQDIVLASGVGSDAVSRHCGMAVRYSVETEPLGTGGTVRNAVTQFRSDPVLVLNGDSLVRFDLDVVLAAHFYRNAAATMVLVDVPDRSRFGAVEIDAASAVAGFGEKGRLGPGLISAGVYILGRGTIETITPSRAVSLEHEVFPALIGQGLYGVVVPGPFIDIGTAESFATADEFVTAWNGA